jgi:hypothetical protein
LYPNFRALISCRAVEALRRHQQHVVGNLQSTVLAVDHLNPRRVHLFRTINALDRDGDLLLVQLAPDEGVDVDLSRNAGIGIVEFFRFLDDRTVLQQVDDHRDQSLEVVGLFGHSELARTN